MRCRLCQEKRVATVFTAKLAAAPEQHEKSGAIITLQLSGKVCVNYKPLLYSFVYLLVRESLMPLLKTKRGNYRTQYSKSGEQRGGLGGPSKYTADVGLGSLQ